MSLVAAFFVLLALVVWGFQLVTVLRVARSVPLLRDLPEGQRAQWPRISAILTACNEEHALESAMKARLADDYPNLEFILVEDRSTDRTPEIADRVAALDPRVKVVHVTALPEGWLGKLNALQQGLTLATGEWIVLSDADTSVHKGALRRLVTWCEARGLDHCAMLPKMLPVSPLLDSFTSTFLRGFMLNNMRAWAIEDPASRASVGIGAFNLVRRGALERTPGLGWLKMEVGDDLCLGEMLKACGARQSIINGVGLADLTFHRTLRESFMSAERPTWTSIGNFSMLRLLFIATAVMLCDWSPLIALALALRQGPLLVVAAGVSVALAIATLIVVNRWLERPLLHLVLAPVATLASAVSVVRSGILGAWRGGIRWRGTFYSNAELKAGRRFGKSWKEFASRRQP